MDTQSGRESRGLWQLPPGRNSGLFWAVLLGLLSSNVSLAQNAPGQATEPGPLLRLEKVGTPEKSFHVVATLIVGPTESILWDTLYKVSDGKRLAARIADTGTRLKAIVLSHADHDHYMGALEVLRRFPGTPIYMTQAGLDDFAARAESDLARERRRGPNPEAPESLPQPLLLPPGPLAVDGREIVVLDGLQGDVRTPANAALWIPSLKTVLAGDLVFEGIHLWLGDSDISSRISWRESLRKLAGLSPLAVVAGHKRDLAAPDSPAQIDFMIRYLDNYDALMSTVSTPEELVEEMVSRYPDLALPGLMAYGARKWFRK